MKRVEERGRILEEDGGRKRNDTVRKRVRERGDRS